MKEDLNLVEFDLEQKLKEDWLFGLFFYSNKVSRNQFAGDMSEHANAKLIVDYANAVEKHLESFDENELTTFGQAKAELLLHITTYMKNAIRVNANVYYGLMQNTYLTTIVSDAQFRHKVDVSGLEDYNNWQKKANIGTANSYNIVLYVEPERTIKV